MSQNQQLEEALSRHPCYNRDAHREFARMHVPVAPRCNIQCNYCNRKYDCCNESRPGVTSEVLSPEQAADKVAYVRERIPNLSVVGIAGPGGGTPEKPVGLVYMGAARGEQVFVKRLDLGNRDRATIRLSAAKNALDAARRLALGLPIPGAVRAETIPE